MQISDPEEPCWSNQGKLDVARPIDSATSLAEKLSACSYMLQKTQSWHNVKLCITQASSIYIQPSIFP